MLTTPRGVVHTTPKGIVNWIIVYVSLRGDLPTLGIMPAKRAAVAKPAESMPAHMLFQESSYILKVYSRGVMRIKLERMACSPLNRGGAGVTGRHAQDVHRLIAERDGLLSPSIPSHGIGLPRHSFQKLKIAFVSVRFCTKSGQIQPEDQISNF